MNALTEFKLPAVPNVKEATKLATPIIDQARELKISDDDSYIASWALIERHDAAIAKVGEWFDPFVTGLHQLHKMAVGLRDQFLDPLLASKNRLLAERKRHRIAQEAAAQKKRDADAEGAEGHAAERSHPRLDAGAHAEREELEVAQPLPAISELIKMPGNAKRGAEIFRSDAAGCIKCHQVNGEGIDFGPNLSEIGTKLGKDALYEAILDPSAGISFGFEAWQIELKSGDEAYGLIVSDTAEEIAVKSQGSIVTRYKKSDVVKREQQKLSIMPAGLQQTMSTEGLVDLVEYLSSLKKALE